MTVTVNDIRREYACDGTTTAFSFPLYFLVATDVKAWLRSADGTSAPLTYTTDYTVTGAGNPAGGTVTTTTAYASGKTLVIVRDPPLVQPFGAQDGGPLPATSINNGFDRLSMQIQRVDDRAGRALRIPDGSSTDDGPYDAGGLPITGLVSSGDPSSAVRKYDLDTIASLVGQAGPVEVPEYDHRAAVQAATIGVGRHFLKTSGYAAVGDGGGALYRRVGSQPSHIGKVQSGDGTWWELAEEEPTTAMFGIADSGDLTNALTAVAALGRSTLLVNSGIDGLTLPASYPNVQITFTGPASHVNLGGPDSETTEAAYARRSHHTQHAGGHPDETFSGTHFRSVVVGSGKDGPRSADIGVSVSASKQGFPGSGQVGEMDAVYIFVRQAGPTPTSQATASDCAAILSDTSIYNDCGYAATLEGVTRRCDEDGNLLSAVVVQMGGINTNSKAFNPDGSLSGNPLGVPFTYGYNAEAAVGFSDVGFLLENSANWISAFRINSYESDAVFDIRSTGAVWTGTGSNRLKWANESGAYVLRDSADTPYASIGPAAGVVAGNVSSGNYVQVIGATTGNPGVVQAGGVDTNVSLVLGAKGAGTVKVAGNSSQKVGFYGATGATKPTITGSKGANAALTSLLTQLAALGLITDSTT